MVPVFGIKIKYASPMGNAKMMMIWFCTFQRNCEMINSGFRGRTPFEGCLLQHMKCLAVADRSAKLKDAGWTKMKTI